MIESCENGNISIYNFHSAALLKRINVGGYSLSCFCLWNNELILAGSSNIIKLIEIKSEKIIKDLNGFNIKVVYIAKINHPKYGESFIYQGWHNEGIKLWINKKDH